MENKKIFENVQMCGSLGISCRKSARAQFFYELFDSALMPFGKFAELRTCPHRDSCTSFRQILPVTALKILEGRQPTCVSPPCLRRNSAQKSAHDFSVNTP